VPFVVHPAGVEELEVGEPYALAEENARRKAAHVAAAAAAGALPGVAPGATVLGVDTIVTIDGDVLGKPADAAEAAAMVARLAGRTHHVVSGLAVAAGTDALRSGTDATEVRFRPLTSDEVAAYVALREWEGRSGAYAIQERGAALVAGITGDYLNVVGLPLPLFLDLLPGRGLQRVFGTTR
jgi:septum formation protein